MILCNCINVLVTGSSISRTLFGEIDKIREELADETEKMESRKKIRKEIFKPGRLLAEDDPDSISLLDKEEDAASLLDEDPDPSQTVNSRFCVFWDLILFIFSSSAIFKD